MLNLNLLCICAVFCTVGVWGASIQPPPVIQTLNATEVGPEFVAVNAPTTEGANAAKPKEEVEVQDAQYWHRLGMHQLAKIVKKAQKTQERDYRRKAKNIIIFIGDGMGLSTITAGRIYKGQTMKHATGEEEMLAFDEFPYTGLAKTYNVDKQVPDSAGTATAMFCGIKTAYGAIGMDITRSKTNATSGSLSSIMDWAQSAGKRTGIVTTTRITHATPSSTYARVYHRDWECDIEVPEVARGIHKDIARQLVENAPGNRMNVIMGGGLSPMGAFNVNEVRSTNFEGNTEKICKRGDGRNLAQEWVQQQPQQRKFVQTRDQLQQVDVKQVDSLMGLFRNNHITYSVAREEGEPSLREMTEAAIGVLERGTDSKGYVLMVEGGRIDQAHHQNYARAALQEVLEFDQAIEAAINATDASETLIIVTADHSHSVTLNGYPKRGNDILGLANLGKNETMVYETITYANGPGYWNHLANGTRPDSKIFWRPVESLSEETRNSPTYRHLAGLPLKDESHGGEDVIVFAQGPGASLVRGVFEQNYVAYVMSYAGCMGPAREFDDTCAARSPLKSGAVTTTQSRGVLLLTILGSLLLKLFY